MQTRDNQVDATKAKKMKLNLNRLPPKRFEGRQDVIHFTNLQKTYKLQGGSESVTALRSVSLQPGAEFYPIKQ